MDPVEPSASRQFFRARSRTEKLKILKHFYHHYFHRFHEPCAGKFLLEKKKGLIIDCRDIVYFESQDNYISFNLEVEDKQVQSIRRTTMYRAMEQLYGRGFLRVHRRFAINLGKLVYLDEGERVAEMRNGKKIVVAAERIKDLWMALAILKNISKQPDYYTNDSSRLLEVHP